MPVCTTRASSEPPATPFWGTPTVAAFGALTAPEYGCRCGCGWAAPFAASGANGWGALIGPASDELLVLAVEPVLRLGATNAIRTTTAAAAPSCSPRRLRQGLAGASSSSTYPGPSSGTG